jgi:ABC-type polar amino acid transport system ATPase subunit
MPGIIEMKNVCKSFADKEVLHHINLSINEGEVVVIIGPSGSGKSTLIRCINCLEMISAGELIVDGIKIPAEREKVRQIRLEVGMVFQQFNLFPHMTALDNVVFGPHKARKMDKGKATDIARNLLGKVGLAEFENKLPDQLSGGQQQRVAIARSLVNDPFFVLADEATGNLDSVTTDEILDIFDALNLEGRTIIMVTHEDDVAERAKRIIRLKDGMLHMDEMVSEERREAARAKQKIAVAELLKREGEE